MEYTQNKDEFPNTFVIDINCDAGESFGAYTIGCDEELFEEVSSVNIACGFHAGDPVVMKKTVQMAVKKGLQIGAHPGFPDVVGFGRREMKITTEELRDGLLYQIGALEAFVKVYGGTITHVKPHGALYSMAAKDQVMATVIVAAIKEYNSSLILVGLLNSEMQKAAQSVGINFATESFLDRNFLATGALVPRDHPLAFVTDEQESVRRALRMIRQGEVLSIEGTVLKIHPQTLCVHSDNSESLRLVKAVKRAFVRENILMKPFAHRTKIIGS